MDEATFLHNVMHIYPDASRILLTGEPGRDAAVSAVSKGHIFQFLTKPCTPDALKTAVEAGVVKYRLANTERAILKETLNGCVQTLMDVLALTRPAAFGRASRLRRQVLEFATTLGCEDYWQLRSRSARFGESLAEQFGAYVAAEPGNHELQAIPLGAVKPGMTVTQDVRAPDGTLVIARGFEVTDVFIEHARTLGPELLSKSVRVLVRSI